MYIPEGFAHGFQTLTDDCELIYHHTEFYTPDAEAGIRYNDAKINIEWPVTCNRNIRKEINHIRILIIILKEFNYAMQIL